MAWQWNVYALPLLLGTLVVIGSTIYLGLKWRSDQSRPGLGLAVCIMLCFVITLVFQVIHDLSTIYEIKLLANQLLYLGIAPMSAFLVAYVLVYTGYENLLTPTTYTLLFLPPALTILAAFTYDLHWTFWTGFELAESAGNVVLTKDHGLGYFGYIIYSYAYLLLSVVLLAVAATGASKTYRRQAGALCLGILFVAVAGLIYVALDIPPHYPTPPVAAFVPASVILTWAVLRRDLFTTVPVAYRTMIEAVDDGVLVANRAGEVTRANGAAADLLGTDRESLQETPLAEILAPLDEEDRLAAVLMDEASIRGTNRKPNAPRTLTEQEWTSDLRGRTIDLSVRPVTQSGTQIGQLVVLKDVTEQRSRERQLRQQNEHLDEFARVVSHDIQGPLMRIRASAEMIDRTGDTEGIETVIEGADRIDRLTGDLLRLARHGQRIERPEEVSLGAVATDAWESLRTEDATLTIESDALLRADPERLQQLLENLFRNSISHAGPGVAVTVGVLEDGLFVADDGPGIPPEKREHVQQRGYTSTDDGTGLGLDIVSHIASAHGWSLSITESDEGGAQIVLTGVEIHADAESHADVSSRQ